MSISSGNLISSIIRDLTETCLSSLSTFNIEVDHKTPNVILLDLPIRRENAERDFRMLFS